MKIFRKIFLSLLLVVCLSFTATACQNKDRKLESTVSGLITKGIALFEIYYVDFPYHGKQYTINSREYLKLSEIGLYEGLDFAKIHSIEKLKALTETVYTKAYAAEKFYNQFLVAQSDGITKFIEYKGDVYIDNERIGGIGGYPVWSTDKMKTSSKTDDTLILEMPGWMKVGSDIQADKGQWKLRLKLVDGEWRLDSNIRDGSLSPQVN